MPDNFLAFLSKLLVGIAVWITTNIYVGAVAIALMSAVTRVIFEDDGNEGSRAKRAPRVFRYFLMSLGLAMLFVHIGLWQKWNKDMTIVISSMFAFMSEETMRFVVSSWTATLRKAVSRVVK